MVIHALEDRITRNGVRPKRAGKSNALWITLSPAISQLAPNRWIWGLVLEHLVGSGYYSPLVSSASIMSGDPYPTAKRFQK
jgi:hypothetical protein